METAVQYNEKFWYATPDISVLWDNSVAPLTRFIFTIICSFATLKKRNAWPSNRTVAKIVGVSVATVKRAYQELTKKGIIMRVPRYKKDKGQTSSLTYIIGREAPCYSMKAPLAIPEAPTEETLFEPVEPSAIPQLTSELPPGSPMSHEGNDFKELKESLTREAELPKVSNSNPSDHSNIPEVTNTSTPDKKLPENPGKDSFIRGECSETTSSVSRTIAHNCSERPNKYPRGGHPCAGEGHPSDTRSDGGNPKEVCTPEDGPDIMKTTAEYFLQMTGRKGLRYEEISVLREFSATQYPTRVQKEIRRACERMRRNKKPLECLTLMYIAAALKDQPTWGRKAKRKGKKSEAQPAPAKKEYTEAELDALQAEAEALQSKLEEEEGRHKLL